METAHDTVENAIETAKEGVMGLMSSMSDAIDTDEIDEDDQSDDAMDDAATEETA
jgi:hypothetical protein